jgi:ABC-type uncharacterized transport system substrate-binding protein
MKYNKIKHLKQFGSIMILSILISLEAFATSNIDTTDKYAWSENSGWLNFNDTNAGGVTVYSDHLEGYVWAENIGLIRLGTHTSGGEHTYANTSATDYGVNNDGSGNLSGYAWSENVGWIKFDDSNGGVTIANSGDFDGYAWAENVGWIHFKNTSPAYKVRQVLPEINVQGNSTSIADGDTTVSTDDDTDFGDVIVGNNTTKTFTIQNTGDAELNLTDSPIVSVTGNGFSVTTQPSSTVAANAETTFVVEFAPTTVGVVTGEISIANDDSDENPYNFNIAANAVNDTPVISDIANQTTNEDTATAAIDFTISDAVTAAGDLTLTGSSSNTTLVSDANIVFGGSDGNRTVTVTPLANQSGSATITVTVSDGSLTATDTFELTVNAVNDAPTAADNTVTLNEDETYTFAEANFEFSDIDSGNSLNQIQIIQLPTVGSLQLNGVDVTQDQVIAVADISNLTFTPAANANGDSYTTFQFKVHDGTSYSDADFTMTIDVDAVNDAPTNTVSDTQATNEDTPLIFSTSNSNLIEISDIEAEDAIGQPVTVTLTATNGTLTLSSTEDLTFNIGDGTDDTSMEFSGTVTNINTALEGMSFTPTSNFNGSASVQIVIDDGTSTDEDTINITVNAVNDIPTSADNTVTLNEDETYTFTEADFEFSDIDSGNSLNKIKITQLPIVGSLQLDGVDVTVNQVIAVADISKLTFTPAANANGNTYATFQFKVYDGTSYSAADFTMTIDVDAVDDAPTAADKTVTVNEDETYTFTEADFEFSDVESGNSLNQIQITQLPTVGSLQLDGVDVTVNQVIAVAEIGNLTFTPAANANGNTYATFQFKVHDGTSYSAANFTMTIDVVAVNDAPSFTKGDDQTVFVNAEQNITAWATNIDAGSENESSQTLSFTVTNNNESLFSAQPAIDASGNLTFTASAAGSAEVTVILSDGIDTSAIQTFNITVNPVPVSTPVEQTTPEPTGCTLGSNINCAVKNEGTITDVKIEPEGSIEGGTLEGEINNEGTIIDTTLAAGTKIDGGQIAGKIIGNPQSPAILINVKITAKTQLTNVILDKTVELPDDVTLTDAELRGSSVNGGKLQGTIRTTSSATVIKNVSLEENTKIIGGKLAGTISGNSKNSAILQHLKVEPETKLINVTIADGVEMSTDVSLEEGVRFTKIENMPTNVDLTKTLPKKGENVDLSVDPVIGGEGILPAINRLPEFVPPELTVLQHDKGFIYLDIEGIRYAVNPIQVKHLPESERLQLESGQTVRFKTDTQIDVLAPPAVQDVSSFNENLSKINLPKVNISNDGNIKVSATETIWYSGRPDLASTIVDKDTPNGFITKEDGNVALIFEDENGEKREQILYPSPADMSALEEFELTSKGILEIEIDGQKIKGRLDYQVKQGTTNSDGIKITEIPDSNGDFMIIYPDGAQQGLFGLVE